MLLQHERGACAAAGEHGGRKASDNALFIEYEEQHSSVDGPVHAMMVGKCDVNTTWRCTSSHAYWIAAGLQHNAMPQEKEAAGAPCQRPPSAGVRLFIKCS